MARNSVGAQKKNSELLFLVPSANMHGYRLNSFPRWNHIETNKKLKQSHSFPFVRLKRLKKKISQDETGFEMWTGFYSDTGFFKFRSE